MKRICFFMFAQLYASITAAGIRTLYGMSMKTGCDGAAILIRKRIYFALLTVAVFFSSAFGQTAPNNGKKIKRPAKKQQSVRSSGQPVIPAVDHHTHIWSLNVSQLVVEPLMPVIEIPAELDRLLRDKERFGGKNKNPSALADLYTKDLLVLNPLGPTWLRGERALSFVTENTEIFRLLPTAYDMQDSSGYIAGYEAAGEGEIIRYLDNFIFVIKKNSDGKWRISSEVFTLTAQPAPKEITADELVREMDSAGVKRAAVLSAAYIFGDPTFKVEDEYVKVRAENDWVAEQTARYADRLFGFCSLNPLKDYALEELNRCVKNPGFKGLKLHVGNARLDVLNPVHIEKL